jgi:ABC-type uncharacterized transport system involved in gliding motility auxiliary subunit
MADSQYYRKKFYVSNLIFLALVAGVLVVLGLTADRTSGWKVDLTADKLYSISPAAQRLLGKLKDEVTVTYYCSEELPSFLANLVRDTTDTLEEFRKLSGGNLNYEVVIPTRLIEKYAAESTDKYLETFKALEDKKPGVKEEDLDKLEPEMPRSIMQMFGPRKPPERKELRANREERVKARARELEKPQEEARREIVYEEFKQQKIEKLAQEGISPRRARDQTGSSVRFVDVYSAIKVSYLNRDPELIPWHQSLESLEHELAQRIAKLTTDDKPVVAFFDGRKPTAPQFDPMNPTPPPGSEYSSVIHAMRELFDVREINLKEGDAIDDVVKRVKEDRERKAREKKGEDEPSSPKEAQIEPADYKLVSSLVVAQPHDLETRQIYEISRAVSLGIPTVFLVSPFSLDISDQGMRQGIPIENLRSGLDELFKKWGFSLGSEILASNECGPIAIAQRLGTSNLMMQQLVPLGVVVASDSQDINQNSGLTTRIPGLAFPGSVVLNIDSKTCADNGIEVEELVWTNKETWSVKIDPFAGAQNPFNPRGRGRIGATLQEYSEDLLRPKDPERFTDFLKKAPLAAFAHGKFPFLYEGEKIPEWKKEEPKEGDKGAAKGPHGGFDLGDGDDFPDPVDPLSPAASQAGGAGGADAGAGQSPPAPAAPGAPGSGASSPEAAGGPQTEAPSPPPPAESPAPPAGTAPPPETAPPAETGPGGARAGTPEAKAGSTQAETGKDAAAPEKSAEKDAPKAHVDVQPGRVLILTSSDGLRDEFLQFHGSFEQYRYNAEFLQNAAQLFGLDETLMEIRRKTLVVRKFKEGSDKSATLLQVLNIAGVPLVVALVGLVRFLTRRQASIRYERRYIEEHSQG